MLQLLAGLKPSFGVREPSRAFCSIGISFAGLEALRLPPAYLRLFRRLAPAFTEGAVRRSVRVGDGGPSAARNWDPAFAQSRAHVLVSWHGDEGEVDAASERFAHEWQESNRPCRRAPAARDDSLCSMPKLLHAVPRGERIGAPTGEMGEWMHFGFRDGISEVCIDNELPRPTAPDCRHHMPGALLLGHANDADFNQFALARAPDKVRAFFRNSCFGILRKMEQDLSAFEDQLDVWVNQLAQVMNPGPSRDFVKAKLCGRWPNGRQMLPGEVVPRGALQLDLDRDPAGEGCPFGSHVRRMRAAPDGNGNLYRRPLQRRSFPFGAPSWSARPTDGEVRGQLGHFFCASIEDQFEHLLGQWAARPPLGLAGEDRAQDPFTGPHDESKAGLVLPLRGLPGQSLRGFQPWTTTRGTMYAWYPGGAGLQALLRNDFVSKSNKGPWL